ncbi:MAG TPA: uracil-DNA glycosylase [Dehalococcoidia bacterium]|nr:uracil-DNA glycosylase [Dehalococcoidia bacterium]
MVMALEERRAALSRLNAGVAACRACALGALRTRAVPGEGPVDAEIMFVGEAPGYYEDQQGRPFVGAAGQFLEQLLASIGLKRTDVFIANVIKCRPPGNRDPLPEEIGSCSRWLDEQFGIIRPKLIVTLGRYSLARFLPGTPIGKVHGQGRKVNGVWVVPMYHPAAALHQGSLRRTIEEDFKKVPAYLEQARRESAPSPAPLIAAAQPQPTQMKLL